MTSGTGVPQQFFNNENSKIGQKLHAFWLITLGPVGITSPNVSTWCALMHILVSFWGPHSKNVGGKNMQNWVWFRTSLDFDREHLWSSPQLCLRLWAASHWALPQIVCFIKPWNITLLILVQLATIHYTAQKPLIGYTVDTFLNVVVTQGAPVLQLLSSKDQTLLIRRNTCRKTISAQQQNPLICPIHSPHLGLPKRFLLF